MTRSSDEEGLATAKHGDNSYPWGQRHDRTLKESETGSIAVTRDAMGDPQETEISASQKMLSAVSGSLLTSLLGKVLHPVSVRIIGLIFSQ